MKIIVWSGIFSLIINLILGFFVYIKNRKNPVNIFFCLLSIAIAFWSVGSSMANIIPDKLIALWILRWCYANGAILPSLFLHFFSIITLETKFRTKILKTSYLFSLLLISFAFTPFFVKNISPRFYPTYFISVPGYIYYFFTLFFSLCGIYGICLLINSIRKTVGYKKLQAKYFFFATIIALIAAVEYFSSVFGIKKFPPLDDFILIIYFSLMTYAILKYRLLDINIALTRAGIFAFVYLFVLGLPLWIGYTTKAWFPSTGLAILLATSGPFIYQRLRKRAEDVILKEQKRYQRALLDLSKTMTRIRDLDKLLHAIVLNVVDTVKVSFAAVYLKDEDYKFYRLKHFFPSKEKSGFPEFIPLEAQLTKTLSQAKKPLTAEEIGSQDKISLDSGLVIPCFMEDNLLGFMVMGAKPNNQMYTPDDLIVFETLSYSTSLAIENCRFWQEIEDHQRKARIAEMDLFSYSVAHEIDNPMTIIKGHADLIKKMLLGLNLPQDKLKELMESLDFILDAQERTSTMIKAIEDYGKPVPADLVPLKLQDVLTGFLSLYLAHFKHHGVYLDKELPANLSYIYLRGIKQELIQVLVNLSNNAIHALLGVPEGEQKCISLKAELLNPDWIRISLSDNGYGIAKENLEAIFVPFTTTKASTEGRGMGLHTCRKIITRHKGRIWAESEGKGKGAAFFIELPIAKDISEEEFKKEDKGKRLF